MILFVRSEVLTAVSIPSTKMEEMFVPVYQTWCCDPKRM